MPLDLEIHQAHVIRSYLPGNRCVETYPFKHAEEPDRPSISVTVHRRAQPGEEGTAISTTMNLSLEAATALAAQLRVHLARIAAP